MLPNRLPHYVFIRLSIWGLQAVAPTSAVYCLISGLGYGFLPRPLELLAFAEALFYFCVSLPRQRILDNSRPHTVERSRRERQALFERCWSSIPDPETFLNVWFMGARLDQIHRDDLKDFLAWSFLYQTEASAADDDELETYVSRVEGTLGIAFPPGRGLFRAMQVSTDPLRARHKPLFFYLVRYTTLAVPRFRAR